MKQSLLGLAVGSLFILPLNSAELIETRPGVFAADLMKRRTADYDYEVPAPGTYKLPVLQPAADGTVLGTNGRPVKLHDLMSDRVTVLSFIYTRCADPMACIRSTSVLSELQRISRQKPELSTNLLLITMSFDPAHDTPGVMSAYGRISLADGKAADWLFLTARNRSELEPLLEAYGQRVDRRKKETFMGPYYHPVRVYLIDPRQRIRNIYSYGLLDSRLVATDALTLLMEKGANQTRLAAGDRE